MPRHFSRRGGAGISGERSGMWKHMARIIGEARPRYAFVENSPMLTSRGLDIVLADLASMGFDAEWGVISAADTGAPHLRERIWVLATDSSFKRWNQRFSNREERHFLHNINGNAAQSQSERDGWKCGIRAVGANVADTNSERRCLRETNGQDAKDAWQPSTSSSRPEWWNAEPSVGRVAHGVAARVDRLKAIGNGQVPAVVRLAWETLRR